MGFFLRKLFIILIVLFMTLHGAVNSYATKPCSDQSYDSNSSRHLSEWIDVSDWAVKVKVTQIDHHWVPYENCYSEDRTKCAQRDDGTFKAEVISILKGNPQDVRLVPVYCSKGIPDHLGNYIFYGVKNQGYDGYETEPSQK